MAKILYAVLHPCGLIMSMIDIQRIYEKAAYAYASELHAYIGLYMKPTAKAEKATRNPNKGAGTLRLMTGKLYRSFAPKKLSDGNIFELVKSGESFTLRYGSTIPYAAIHEYGGTAGKGAVIPKRPYLAPAVREWKRERAKDFQKTIKLEIIQEIKTWLANQRQ